MPRPCRGGAVFPPLVSLLALSIGACRSRWCAANAHKESMLMNSFVPQMEILPLSQQRVWSSLTPVCKARFVLYGGTAVVLRLGHRQSTDFDFFSDQPLDKSRIYKMLPILADATVLQDTPASLGLLVPVDVSADRKSVV